MFQSRQSARRSKHTVSSTSNKPTSEYEDFGPYEVYERLGVGGMATVHRAKERGIEGFERIVALKRLLPHLAEDASFVRSFVREAKLASLLQHVNIVQIYELGRVGPIYFISMEYIEGRDIRRILRQARKLTGPPPLSVFLALMTQLCDALDYAHKRCDSNGEPLGLVHRDVSPSNLLITHSGHLKIIDFGIAKAQTTQLRTKTGRIKGKLAYMAPEAIKGQELDARSDIFACGVIAHELLTARPLFATKNEYETLMRLQSAEVKPPSARNPQCPPELDDIVLMALERDPADRWQSAAEFRDALQYVRAQYQVNATNSEIASWMEWAFALTAPATGSFPNFGSQSVSRSFSGNYPSAPQRAFARIKSRSGTGSLTPLTGSHGSRPVTSDPSPDKEAEARAEEGADIWGSQEEGREEPVLLEEVPDVSHKMAFLDTTTSEPGKDSSSAAAEPAESPSVKRADSEAADVSFGAGIIASGEGRPRTGLYLGLGLLAIGALAAVYFLVLRQSASSGDAAAEKATIKFKVDPADVSIDILGYGTHQGSPYKLEVDAPGSYRVEIKREGHKTYVTQLEVEPGEHHVVSVTLVAGGGDKAQVELRSTPGGQTIVVDEEELDKVTPSTLELPPGKHVIALKSKSGTEMWRHEFDAAANTQYLFSPVLEGKKARRRDKTGRRIAARRSGRRETPEKPEKKEPVVDDSLIVDDVQGSARRETADITKGISAPSLGKLDTRAPVLDVPKKDPIAKPPPKRVGPVTVPPNAVKKRSGGLPRLPTTREDVPNGRASAKLCIDTKGRVDSATVYTQMHPRAKSKLRDALKKWRYKPYKQGGKAVPACFAVNFTIELAK